MATDTTVNTVWIHARAVFENARVKLWCNRDKSGFEKPGIYPRLQCLSKVQACGDNHNLFDKENLLTSETAGYVSTDYIPVKMGDRITKSNSTTLFFYDKDKQSIGSIFNWEDGIIDDNRICFVRCDVLENDLDRFMIVKNSNLPINYVDYDKSSINFTVCNKNLIDIEPFELIGGTNPYYGKGFVFKLKAGTYTLQRKFKNSNNAPASAGMVQLYIDGRWFKNLNRVEEYCSFILEKDCELKMSFMLSTSIMSETESTIEFYDIQLEKGDIATKYMKHEGQYFTMPMTQKMYEGDYLAEDGFHYNFKEIIVDGINRKCTAIKEIENKELIQWCISLSDVCKPNSQCFSNVAIQATEYGTANTFVNNAESNIYFHHDKSILNGEITTDKMNEILQQMNESGNPVKFICMLKEEEIVPYTEEQQEIYNNIKEAHGYMANTNIFCNDNISAFFDLTYWTLFKGQEGDIKDIDAELDNLKQQIDDTSTSLKNDYMTTEQIKAENNTLKEDLEIIKEQQASMELTSSGLQIQIDEIVNDGVTTVKNTTVDINEDGISVGKGDSEFTTTMNNTGTYMYAYGKEIARYDKDGLSTGNLKATGEVEIGYLKILKAIVNNERRTHIHWIGG